MDQNTYIILSPQGIVVNCVIDSKRNNFIISAGDELVVFGYNDYQQCSITMSPPFQMQFNSLVTPNDHINICDITSIEQAQFVYDIVIRILNKYQLQITPVLIKSPYISVTKGFHFYSLVFVSKMVEIERGMYIDLGTGYNMAINGFRFIDNNCNYHNFQFRETGIQPTKEPSQIFIRKTILKDQSFCNHFYQLLKEPSQMNLKKICSVQPEPSHMAFFEFKKHLYQRVKENRLSDDGEGIYQQVVFNPFCLTSNILVYENGSDDSQYSKDYIVEYFGATLPKFVKLSLPISGKDFHAKFMKCAINAAYGITEKNCLINFEPEAALNYCVQYATKIANLQFDGLYNLINYICIIDCGAGTTDSLLIKKQANSQLFEKVDSYCITKGGSQLRESFFKFLEEEVGTNALVEDKLDALFIQFVDLLSRNSVDPNRLKYNSDGSPLYDNFHPSFDIQEASQLPFDYRQIEQMPKNLVFVDSDGNTINNRDNLQTSYKMIIQSKQAILQILDPISCYCEILVKKIADMLHPHIRDLGKKKLNQSLKFYIVGGFSNVSIIDYEFRLRIREQLNLQTKDDTFKCLINGGFQDEETGVATVNENFMLKSTAKRRTRVKDQTKATQQVFNRQNAICYGLPLQISSIAPTTFKKELNGFLCLLAATQQTLQQQFKIDETTITFGLGNNFLLVPIFDFNTENSQNKRMYDCQARIQLTSICSLFFFRCVGQPVIDPETEEQVGEARKIPLFYPEASRDQRLFPHIRNVDGTPNVHNRNVKTITLKFTRERQPKFSYIDVDTIQKPDDAAIYKLQCELQKEIAYNSTFKLFLFLELTTKDKFASEPDISIAIEFKGHFFLVKQITSRNSLYSWFFDDVYSDSWHSYEWNNVDKYFYQKGEIKYLL